MVAYRTILVPTDASGSADRATDHALEIAERHGATIRALYVLDDRYLSGDVEGISEVTTVETALAEEGDSALETVTDRATARGLDASGVIRRGVPASTIVDYADEIDADLVVLGTHGRSGLGRLLLGSVAERVVRNATPPVLTARNRDAPASTEYEDILMPTDGSDAAMAALDHALEFAERYDATLHAYSVVDARVSAVDPLLESFREMAASAVETVADRAAAREVDVTTAVEDGTPAAGIVGHAEEIEADLITMGTHGRTGIDRVAIGSVAERVVRRAPMPVVTVRQRS